MCSIFPNPFSHLCNVSSYCLHTQEIRHYFWNEWLLPPDHSHGSSIATDVSLDLDALPVFGEDDLCIHRKKISIVHGLAPKICKEWGIIMLDGLTCCLQLAELLSVDVHPPLRNDLSHCKWESWRGTDLCQSYQCWCQNLSTVFSPFTIFLLNATTSLVSISSSLLPLSLSLIHACTNVMILSVHLARASSSLDDPPSQTAFWETEWTPWSWCIRHKHRQGWSRTGQYLGWKPHF